MKLIKPSFEILEQNNIFEHIERCGRVCYKSEDKITENSSSKFVDMLIKRGHWAALEHGTVYLKYDIIEHGSMNFPNKYYCNKYSEVTYGNEALNGYETPEYKENFSSRTYAYITTNYRVLLENDWMDDLKYQCEPTEHHVKRVTVKFICDRGVSHEFVRHRIFSFCQESTRYCNYSKDKFNNECTFIIPNWVDFPRELINIENIQCWEFRNGENFGHVGIPENIDLKIDKETCRFLISLKNSEQSYFTLLKIGWIAQQARAVLPNALKTELVMTGTIEQWKEFFKLRDAKDTHPSAFELANPLHAWFRKKGLIE